MKRTFFINLLFLRKILDESSFLMRLVKLSLYFEFLLPSRMLFENRVARFFGWAYTMFMVFLTFILPMISIYFLFPIFYILTLGFEGTLLHIYIRLYPKEIKRLDSFLYKSYFREYFLGNPGSKLSRFMGGAAVSYFGCLGGLCIENKIALDNTVETIHEARKAGLEPDFNFFTQQLELNKREMPFHSTANRISELVDRTSFGAGMNEKGTNIEISVDRKNGKP